MGKLVACRCLCSDLAIAGVVWFVLTLFFVMNAFGPAGAGPTQGSEWRMWFLLIVGILFPPIEIFLIKRAFLSIFRIQTGGRAWTYSIVITILLLAAILIPPVLFFYLV